MILLIVGAALGLATASAWAQDATWLGATDDFGLAANWDAGTVPTGTASFGSTAETTVSVNDTRSLGGLTFNADAAAYTVNVTGELISTGAGIVNNSSATQTLAVGSLGQVSFHGSGTTGNAAVINNGTLYFYDASSVDSSVFENNNITLFRDASTAGTSTITNNGQLLGFQGSSTAGSATISNYKFVGFYNTGSAANAMIDNKAYMSFNDDSTADNATIYNLGSVFFQNESSAGTAVINNDNFLGFNIAATGGDATITNTQNLYFYDRSTAGNARLITTAAGVTDFSSSTGPAGDGEISAGSIEGEGSYILGARTLTAGGNNLSTTVSGVISGAGGSLNKAGSGTLTLTGINTYTGPTIVAQGSLVVGDDATPSASIASAVTVKAGATLGGRGSVETTVIEDGGTLAPGAAGLGTLTVEGNLTFGTGSNFQVEVNPAGVDSDLVAVNGTAYLGGAVAHVGAGGTYQLSSTYTILTATGGIDGKFAGATSNFAFLDPELSYGASDVLLTLKRNDIAFGSYAHSSNQMATAGGLESLDPANPLYQAIVSLGADAPTIQDAFDGLSGEIHASAKGMLIEDSRFIRDVTAERIRAAFGDGSLKSLPVMAYDEGAPEPAPANTDRAVGWGQAFGSRGSAGNVGNAASSDHSIAGLLIGVDGFVADNWRAGVVAGYSHSSFSAPDRGSSGDSDSYHLGIYGGTQWGALGFRTGAAYSWHRIETARSVAFPGLSESLKGGYDAGTAQAFGELGYRVDVARGSFEPFASLAYVSLRTAAFAEQGGAAALTSGSSTRDTTFTTFGVRASSQLLAGRAEATLRGMIGWRHALGGPAPLSTFSFSHSDDFAIAGAPIAKDCAVVEAGLDFGLTKTATLGVSYSSQFGSGTSDNGAKASLVVRF